jgi:HEAT repeat protein
MSRRPLLARLGLVAASLAIATIAFAQPAPRPGTRDTTARAARPARGKPAKVDIPAATRALSGSDVAAAKTAAEQLGSVTDPAAHGALLDALVTGLHPDVAVAALDGLARAKAETDVPTVLAYARHRNPTVRAAAIRALSAYSSP